jgi:hypothetical protein
MWTARQCLKALRPTIRNCIPACVCCQVGLRTLVPDPVNYETSITSSSPQGHLCWTDSVSIENSSQSTHVSVLSSPTKAEISALFTPSTSWNIWNHLSLRYLLALGTQISGLVEQVGTCQDLKLYSSLQPAAAPREQWREASIVKATREVDNQALYKRLWIVNLNLTSAGHQGWCTENVDEYLATKP